MKRLLPYSLAVTFAAGIGALLVGFCVGLVFGDDDPSGYVIRLAGSVVAAAPIFAAIALLYCAGVALIAGGIRRPAWWVGALAGGLPALAFGLILNQGIGGDSYVGTPEDLNELVQRTLTSVALVVIWCAGAGAVLMKLIMRLAPENIRTH